VGICDNLHRELAEERLGLRKPQAIIGACGARVERVLRPTSLRPAPRTGPPVARRVYVRIPINRIFPAQYAAFAPAICGERKRPARTASEHLQSNRSNSSPLQPAKRPGSRRSRRLTTEPRGSCCRHHKRRPAEFPDSPRSHHSGRWDSPRRKIRKAEPPGRADKPEHIRSHTDWPDSRTNCNRGTCRSSSRWRWRGRRTRRGGERDVSFLNFLFEGVGGSLPVSNGSICRSLTSEQTSTEPAAGGL
jgi:hypothetical protein